MGCLHRAQSRAGKGAPLRRRRALEHRVAHQRVTKPHPIHPQLAVRLHQARVYASAQRGR